MVSWGTIKSLALFFGPLVLPRAFAYYRANKNRPASQIKPLQQKTSHALAVLFISGLVAFLSTFPLFAPENVFRLTQSRLHTSAGVLLTRLAAIRPLTSQDEQLRTIFDAGGLDARLLYARYGPDIVLNNPLSKPGDIDSPKNYLLYALPSILLPHILHLFTLGIATSTIISGKEASRWRAISIISGLALAAIEIWYISYYDDTPNLRSVRVNDMDFVAWKLPIYRGLAIAAVDGFLGWVIWLQATGRAFIAPRLASERIMDHGKQLELIRSKVQRVGVLRNGTSRDAGSRRRVEDYWVKDGEVMRDVMEQPDVLEAQRNALKRQDTVRLNREIEGFVEGFVAEALSTFPSGARAGS